MQSRESQYLRLLHWNNSCADEFVSYQNHTSKLEVYRIRADSRGTRVTTCVSSKEIPHINCLDFNSDSSGGLSAGLAIGSTTGAVTLIDVYDNAPDFQVNNQKKFGRYFSDHPLCFYDIYIGF